MMPFTRKPLHEHDVSDYAETMDDGLTQRAKTQHATTQRATTQCQTTQRATTQRATT
jgi:hypothetical protein